jgi:hypothetical protein
VPDGACIVTTTWVGAQEGLVSVGSLAVGLVGHATIDTSCPTGAPPPGVALDGQVIVSVTGGPGIPLPGSHVSLRASIADEPFQALEAITDDDGTATFLGVGRGEDGTAVDLVASVARTTYTLVDGCTFSQHWSGSGRGSGGDVAGGTVSLPVATSLTTSVACAPPGPYAPTLSGIVRDEVGAPIAVAAAWLSMTRIDGGTWLGALPTAAGGSFAVPIQPWGTDDDPARLELHVLGVPTRQRVVGDCIHTEGPAGSLVIDVALADGLDPDPVIVVTAVGDLSVVCGVVAAPSPVATPDPDAPDPGPAITLPPTDVAAIVDGGSGSPILPALVAALGAFALLLGLALIRRDA